MLFSHSGEPDAEHYPAGLVGPLNPRLPSTRDGEPPMPARTQKYAPPPVVLAHPFATGCAAASLRLAMFVALGVYLIVTDAKELPPEWVLALVGIGIWIIPEKVLIDLITPSVRWWHERGRRQSLPVMVQMVSGDTWITQVPTIQTHHGERTAVRLPFRVLSALAALLGMFGAMATDGEIPLLMRILMFLFGAVFGGIALVPGGDLARMFPRISTAAPRLSAPRGDADADAVGVVGTDVETRGEDQTIDG